MIDYFRNAQVLVKEVKVFDFATFSGLVNGVFPQVIHNFVGKYSIMRKSLKN